MQNKSIRASLFSLGFVISVIYLSYSPYCIAATTIPNYGAFDESTYTTPSPSSYNKKASLDYKATKSITTSYKDQKKRYKDANPCDKKICDPFRVFATLTGGYAWSKVGESQSFIDDDSLYQYDADTDTQSKPLWGAVIGEELRFYDSWAIQLGIAYYQISNLKAKGVLTQGVNPETYEQYNYSYYVTSRQYLLEAKVMGDMTFGFHPYILGGIGGAFNTTFDYDINIRDDPFPFATFTPIYNGETNNNFSYSAGIGIDFDLSKYARLGIGYRFAWLGAANLGEGEINTAEISNTLKQDNLTASEAILQLTFLI